MNFWHRLSFYFKYLSNPPWDTDITPPEVQAFVAGSPPGRALDLGCGTGTNAIYLTKCGWEVIGVDFIHQAIRKARKKAHTAGVEVKFVKDDVTQLKAITGAFDLILDIGCLHSIPAEGRTGYMKNVSRLLHPQGTYLLYAFVKNEEESGPGLGPAELEMLEERFELVKRQDGTDRGRNSAWFTWQKLIDPTPVQ